MADYRSRLGTMLCKLIFRVISWSPWQSLESTGLQSGQHTSLGLRTNSTSIDIRLDVE